MKVALTTLHCTDNCGSCLQAFALEKAIRDQGHEVEIIDYRPSYLLNNGRPLRTLLKKFLYAHEMKQKQTVFSSFLERYLICTKKKYISYAALEKAPPEADCYVVGSDQVWNCDYPCGQDPAFYLNFVKHTKKIAYAVSLGRTPIPEQDIKFFKPMIQDFHGISVREESSLSVIGENYPGNVEYVCDPTLLHDRTVYDAMAKEPVSHPYCVVYLAEKSQLLDETIDWVRKTYGYRIIQLTGVVDQCAYDEKVISIGPEEWLGYVKNASMVVAGSFHATVFSLIFHRQFVSVLPAKNRARIEQLLEKVDLQERIVSTASDLKNLHEIDFQPVDQKIYDFRASSMEFLRRAIYAPVNEWVAEKGGTPG